MKIPRLLILLVFCAALGTARANPTLWLIGDSTVQVGTKGQQGWGTQLPKFFDPAKIQIVNCAKGGRSSRTFLTEGLWEAVHKDLKPGDYVMMQFGHNDSGPIGGEFAPGRPARASIPGNSDEAKEVDMPGDKKETVHSYGWYLRNYAAEAKASGAHVIVVSPIPKRGFIEGKARRDGGGYAGVAQQAAQQAGVFFLNLSALVADKYDAMGEAASTVLFNDGLHTTPEGAALNASCVSEGVRALKDCDLKNYLLPEVPKTN